MTKRSFEERLTRVWWEGAPADWWQYVLAPLYRAVSKAEQTWQRAHARHPGVPVIVIGNLAVGGSGKTPVVLAIVDWLQTQGWSPGIVSRGYGAKVPVPRLVDASDQAETVGDEPLMMKQRLSEIPIAVSPNRYQAAKLLVEHGVDIIVSDDGLQHHRLARDVEICVVDGERLHGNQKLLPLGPLREPVSRLEAVDLIVQNGGDPSLQDGWWTMQLRGQSSVDGYAHDDNSTDGAVLRRLADDEPRAIAHFDSESVEAIAGIGNADRFFQQLRMRGLNITEHNFADHQAFDAALLERFRGKRVVMTEKDAVKCRPFAADQDWWYWPVSAALPEAFFVDLAQLLQENPND